MLRWKLARIRSRFSSHAGLPLLYFVVSRPPWHRPERLLRALASHIGHEHVDLLARPKVS